LNYRGSYKLEIRKYAFKEVDNEKLIVLIEDKFKSAGITDFSFRLNFGQVYCDMPKEQIKGSINLLKKDSDLNFDYIKCITGADYIDYLEVIYSLYSFENNYTINIKSKINTQNPEIDSITQIFMSADWFEREIWEFFGINFKGHKNLKTLLLPGDVDYHPLLKSFEIKWEERPYIRPTVFE
ncbi:MAG: NADH-quinone oxidoreductase subunit C, partial [Candidatus Humimicrobiaceae bacterium]